MIEGRTCCGRQEFMTVTVEAQFYGQVTHSPRPRRGHDFGAEVTRVVSSRPPQKIPTCLTFQNSLVAGLRSSQNQLCHGRAATVTRPIGLVEQLCLLGCGHLMPTTAYKETEN